MSSNPPRSCGKMALNVFRPMKGVKKWIGPSAPACCLPCRPISSTRTAGSAIPSRRTCPARSGRSKNLNGFLWGLIRQDLPVTNCRLANGQRLGIEEIRVGRSFLQGLATFLTLGLWAPARISWRCCRPPPQSGTLD